MDDVPCLEEQLRGWWGTRRPALQLEEVRRWTLLAESRLARHGSLDGCLADHGITLVTSSEDNLLAGLRLRARLDLDRRRLTVYLRALPELEPHGATIPTLVAHECFHLLCPECPPRWQEAAAHWFTARVARLHTFPGLWDRSKKSLPATE